MPEASDRTRLTETPFIGGPTAAGAGVLDSNAKSVGRSGSAVSGGVHRGSSRGLMLALLGIALLLTTVPSFFDIYRGAAFKVAPRDDYAPSLLAMVGESASVDRPTLFAKAPFGYRVLSVAVAIPFFHVLPYYPFSNLEQPDKAYLRATAALSMVSYLSMLLTGVTIYCIARRVMRRSTAASLLAALLSVGAFQFLSLGGVDPLAVLVISLLILFLDKPAIFVPVIIASAAVNEKIVVVFTVALAGRLLVWLVQRSQRFPYWPQAVSTCVAVAAYAAMRQFARLPGNEAHTNLGTWLEQATATIALSLSLKGFIQNGVPLMVVAILLVVAYGVWREHAPIAHFSPLDLMVAPALLLVASIIGAQFTVGRAVMHSFPFYLPLLAFVFDDHLFAGSLESEGHP